MTNTQDHAVRIFPGSFEARQYWYERAYTASIHPLLDLFLNLDNSAIVERYCHIFPNVDADALHGLLNYELRNFPWAGADLVNVVDAKGYKDIVLIENNSCPSGQKSMPVPLGHHVQGGYRDLIERAFKPFIERDGGFREGALAIIYDKNAMENAGYAAAMADVFDEPVFLATYKDDDPNSAVRFKTGVLEVRDEQDIWHPVRAAFRYVTQRPWNRIPIFSKTRIFNPVIACLAGGRNKLVASKAYVLFNAEYASAGLRINIPETICDVSKDQVPYWIHALGGQAVVKVPYSNAGMGVYTIVSNQELDLFMKQDFEYDQFIVQSLIGHVKWINMTAHNRLYHVGMISNISDQPFVFDMRMMICGTREGIRPVAVYSRRAVSPLKDNLLNDDSSWNMLGTNLSSLDASGEWQTDTSRLLVMDRNTFDSLGLTLDDLIKAFVQTVLSTIAIDKMAEMLLTTTRHFRQDYFTSLDDDNALIRQILRD